MATIPAITKSRRTRLINRAIEITRRMTEDEKQLKVIKDELLPYFEEDLKGKTATTVPTSKGRAR